MRKRSSKGGCRVPRKGVTPRFTCREVFGNWYIQDQADGGDFVALTPRQDVALLLVAAANDFTARMAAGAVTLGAELEEAKRQATEAARKRKR